MTPKSQRELSAIRVRQQRAVQTRLALLSAQELLREILRTTAGTDQAEAIDAVLIELEDALR